MLSHRDLVEIRRWAAEEPNPLRTLMSLTFDGEALIRWRAIEVMGPVAADQAAIDPERVREFLRRLLWLMNDESGGVSWHSPEMIGEVLVNVPSLIKEYAPLLPSFLHEEPFERGTHLALWRVARIKPDAFEHATEQLGQSLIDPDPAIRAFAARAVLEIDPSQGDRIRMQLTGDQAGFSYYDFESGEFQDTSVALMVGRR